MAMIIILRCHLRTDTNPRETLEEMQLEGYGEDGTLEFEISVEALKAINRYLQLHALCFQFYFVL